VALRVSVSGSGTCRHDGPKLGDPLTRRTGRWIESRHRSKSPGLTLIPFRRRLRMGRVRALKLAKENHAPRIRAATPNCMTACAFWGPRERRSQSSSRRSPRTFIRSVFFLTVEPNTTIDLQVPTTYSAAIRPPWTPLATRSPIAWSIFRQYSIARANTGSLTPSLRWPTTLETSRSRWPSSITLRTKVPA
jgi:hypothetical protein